MSMATTTWRRQRDFHENRRRSTPENLHNRQFYDLCTLFIDNIPRGTGRWELVEFFSRFGEVARVYVTDKKRKGRVAGFAFLNFRWRRDRMALLISQADVWFKGRRLFIGVEASSGTREWRSSSQQGVRRQQQNFGAVPKSDGARSYNMDHQQRQASYGVQQKMVRQVWRRKTAWLVGEGKEGRDLRTIDLDEVKEVESWLSTSVVVKSVDARSYNEVFELVAKEHDSAFKLIVLNHFTFVIVFDGVASRDVFLQQKSHLGAFFHSIEVWSASVRNELRRVWLTIRGMPLHGWSRDNFIKIAKLFGEVLEVDEWSVDGVAMEEARVRVLTKEMGFVCEELLAKVGRLCVSIYVSESYHLGNDSWTVKYNSVAREDRGSGDVNGEQVKEREHDLSCVPESSCNASVRGDEAEQGSASGSTQKTRSARVDYDLAREELLIHSQRNGVELNEEGERGPPGFEVTNEPLDVHSNVRISNGSQDPINAPILEVSTDSNVAAQAIALVKLLDGQVIDEQIAKEVIVSQRRSQRIAQRLQ